MGGGGVKHVNVYCKQQLQQHTRGRSTTPASEEERRNTRCSNYIKDTGHDGYGGIPWRCTQAAFGAAPRHKTS